MLQVINSPTERQKVIRKFNAVLKSDLSFVGDRTVGSRGGNYSYRIYSYGAGRLWAVPSRTAGEGTPRSWAPMGIFDPERNALDITIEINIAHEVNGRAAGVVARDSDTGEYYLLHDGGVSGGRKGIGRDFFLAHSSWSMSNRTTIYDGDVPAKQAVMLGRIKPGLTRQIETYVTEAFEFKRWATANDERDLASITKVVRSIKLLTDEFAGQNRRGEVKACEYDVIHGYIVKALLGPVDGFEQDEAAGECDDGAVVLGGLFAA